MASQPSLRARILPRFPANVLAGTGITITKNGGTYTFAVQAYADIPITALANIPADRLLGRDTSGVGPVEIIQAAGGIGFNGVGNIELTSNQRIRAIPVVMTAGVGAVQDMMVPFACTITKVTVLADVTTGTAQLTIWKDTYANWPPTVADTIVGTPPISTVSGKFQDDVLTSWNTSILAGDILRFGATLTGVARLNVTLEVVTL